MGQSVKTCSKDGDLDLVITNALIVDSTGIVKADIGIKDGKIAGIGKAGNPDIMDGVTPGMTVGASTEALAGEGMIGTAQNRNTLWKYAMQFLMYGSLQQITNASSICL